MNKKIRKILEALGLVQKFESRQLTSDDYAALCAEYQKKYGTSMEDDMSAERSASLEAEHQRQINSLYNIVSKANGDNNDDDHADDGDGGGDNDGGDNGDNGDGGDDKDGKKGNKQNASFEQLASAVSLLAGKVENMSKDTAPDLPVATVKTAAIPINGFATNKNFLFGIDNPMFSMTKRWNQIAANPSLALTSKPDEQTDGVSFRQETMAYAKSLAARYAYHHGRNELDAKRLASGEFVNNYSGVDDAGLGNQFVILRQDALIARILAIRDLTQYFPVRYGVQDRDVLFNAFMGEVSQAYQEGEIYKGSMSLENEMGYVDDAMIKVKFGPMKEIERKYIAYLKKEGSDPIKWSMIEFCLLNLLKQAQLEQNKRRMRGIYVKPEAGVPSHYLNSSTGIVYTLLRYIHDYSIKPFDSEDYRHYTSADMLACVKEFISDVKSKISEDMDLDQHVLYLNKNHQDWWIANCRTTYGKDIDFDGPESMKFRVPDTEIPIVWLPYLGQSCLMFLDIPGNLQFIENLPGEMLAVRMESFMETVRAWSTWKEGTGASFTGRKFKTKQEMDANDYDFQQIFTNLPATTVVAGVDGKDGFWHITDSTTTAESITDITNAKAGVAYCIQIGAGTTTKPKVEKKDKFDGITADWIPTAEGDYIMVILGSNQKYRELERCVGGKRTINTAVQPNVPGGR